MPVTQRGASWQAQVNHKLDRYRRNFPTKQEAELWQAESKARLLRGETPDMGESARREAGKPHTLKELIEHVYATHWAPMSGGEKAIYNARDIVGIIGPTMAITKLSRMDVDKARAALLKRGNQPATVNKKVAALSKALSIYADDNPTFAKPKMAKYSIAEGRIRRFSPGDETAALAFFEHIGNQDMVDYVVLSLDTGMRQGEVLSIRYEDCTGTKATVWGTKAKSGKTRTIPLTARAQATIARRFKEAGDRTDILRTEVFEGVNRWSVAHYWDRLATAMKMQDDKDFVPHILRHEFCSRLADRGLNAAVIKELAGHSSLVVTQRYIRVGAQALVDAIAALEKAELAMVAPAAQQEDERPHMN